MLLVFCVGAIGGYVTTAASGGRTVLTLTPLMSAWGIVATVAGSDYANRQQWASYSIAGVMHGIILSLSVFAARWALSRAGMRVDGARGFWLIPALTLAYITLLLLFPVGDGP